MMRRVGAAARGRRRDGGGSSRLVLGVGTPWSVVTACCSIRLLPLLTSARLLLFLLCVNGSVRLDQQIELHVWRHLQHRNSKAKCVSASSPNVNGVLYW